MGGWKAIWKSEGGRQSGVIMFPRILWRSRQMVWFLKSNFSAPDISIKRKCSSPAMRMSASACLLDDGPKQGTNLIVPDLAVLVFKAVFSSLLVEPRHVIALDSNHPPGACYHRK